MRLCTDLSIPVPPPPPTEPQGPSLADYVRGLAWDGHRRTLRDLGEDMHEGPVRLGRRVRR